MSHKSFLSSWRASFDISHEQRCQKFINEIFGRKFIRDNAAKMNACFSKPSPPLYVADASCFNGEINNSILPAHQNCRKICIPSSVLVEIQRNKACTRWAKCCHFFSDMRWTLLSFDFEYLAYEAQSAKFCNLPYEEATTAGIVVACSMELAKTHPTFATFVISSNRETQRLATRQNLILRTPTEKNTLLLPEEKSIFREATKHLSSRERKTLERQG
ncbi:hypothetical protein XU18_1564 [Perkinsela sp. CCAP 1560/4]|nr:hypothetical protein XU18_1564 [Perkinsela sp. CCAP 1560/4]|eukprot:KNH07794.1 hypothetical protein XU18_1564 [Perkinsela sp. CCAP 1560/4]